MHLQVDNPQPSWLFECISNWAMTLSISTLTLQCLYAFLKNSKPKSQRDISQFIPFQPAFQKKETAVPLHVLAMLHISGSGGRMNGWMDGWVNENKEAARSYDLWLPFSLGIWSLNFSHSGIKPNWFQHIIGRCSIKIIFLIVLCMDKWWVVTSKLNYIFQ